MTIKNHLVKTFLTSITFDSLSRKIKIPCLVIKKNLYQKEIFKMKILKTKKLFTYMVVGALVMALSISCKNEETNPNSGKVKYSVLVGTWRNGENSFTIDSLGYLNFTYNGKTYNNIIINDMESESYEDTLPGASVFSSDYKYLAAFHFTSSSSCEVSISEYTNNQTVNTTLLGTFTK